MALGQADATFGLGKGRCFLVTAEAEVERWTANDGAAGGINHFVTEYFCLRAGIRMTPVPCRGTAPEVTDLIAGNIRVMVTTVASASAAIREGRVRVVAATAPGGGLPPNVGEVPTAREQGIDALQLSQVGIYAPRGTPA